MISAARNGWGCEATRAIHRLQVQPDGDDALLWWIDPAA